MALAVTTAVSSRSGSKTPAAAARTATVSRGRARGRRPTIIRVTTITVARRAVIRGRRVTLIRSAMSGTISRGTAMIFAKVSRLRNVIAAMITG